MDFTRRTVLEQVVAPHLPPDTGTWQAVSQPQHVPGDVRPGCSIQGLFPLHVIHHGQLDLFARKLAGRTAKIKRIPTRHPPGVVICLPAHHDAIQAQELFLHHLIRLNAPDKNSPVLAATYVGLLRAIVLWSLLFDTATALSLW